MRAACGEFLPVAGQDQQRVVDPHAQTDQHHDRRSEVGHREHVRRQRDEPSRTEDGEERREQRQRRGDQGTEQQDEDHQRGEHPRALGTTAGLLGATDRVTTDLHPELLGLIALRRGDDPADVFERDRLRRSGEEDGRVADGARRRDCGIVSEGAAHGGDGRQRPDAREHRVDVAADRRSCQAGWRFDDDLNAVGGGGGAVLPQKVSGGLGLRAGQREVVSVGVSGGLRSHRDGDDDQKPGEQRRPTVPL